MRIASNKQVFCDKRNRYSMGKLDKIIVRVNTFSEQIKLIVYIVIRENEAGSKAVLYNPLFDCLIFLLE